MTKAKPTDQELLTGIASGDEDAFRVLYGRYKTGVYAYLQSMAGDEQQAQELLQDVFVSIARQPKRFRDALNFRAYFFTTVRNAVFKLTRRKMGTETQMQEGLLELVQPRAQSFGNFKPRVRYGTLLRWYAT